MTAIVREEEVAIRRIIEGWAKAVRAKDINGVIAHHTDDVVMYDVPPPIAVRGISAYRETWPPFFEALTEGEAAFDIVELQITTGDTVAFESALLRLRFEGRAGQGPRAASAIDDRLAEGRWRLEDRPRASLFPRRGVVPH
jgi:uncharacterized protein (TIGR02246 family)